MLKALDILLFLIHVVVVFGNLFGWIWKRTRKAHLILVCLTLISWFVLGIWKGWGYCVLTDWEWDVKRALGEQGLPSSFTVYLANNIFGLNWSRALVDSLTLAGLIIAIVGAAIMNIKDLRERKRISK